MPMFSIFRNNSILLAVLSLGVGACSPYPDWSSLSNDSNESEFQKLSDSNLRIQVMGESKPHFYSVELKWKIEGGGELSLHRLGIENGALRESNLGSFSTSARFVDTKLSEGTTWTYELRDSLGSKRALRAVSLPLDLVVTGEMLLPPNYKDYDRLFFEEDSKLLSRGSAVSWKLSELRGANGASLISFKDSDEATGHQVGQASGRLLLETKFFEGDLSVEWRGQRGAQGLEANENLVRGKQGSKGSDGQSAWSRSSESRCVRPASAGGRGGKGPEGFTGERGFSGGNLEAVMIRFEGQSESARLFVNAEVGRGGRGGMGGHGGRGGRGGRGGSGGTECADARDGVEGERGARGESGEEGREGVFLGGVCARIGEQIVQGPCSR